MTKTKKVPRAKPPRTIVFKKLAPAVLRRITWNVDFLLESTFKQFVDLSDDRAIALVGAMVVEVAINDFLTAAMPGFEDIRDLTFSQKIAIGRALDFCPRHYFSDADLIRQIRNDFSHKLALRDFQDVEDEYLQSLRDRVKKLAIKLPDLGRNSDGTRYIALAGATSAFITFYTMHVAMTSDYVRSNDFPKQFANHLNGLPPIERSALRTV